MLGVDEQERGPRGWVGGWGLGGILNLCLTPHLSHGIWFVFKQWSQ